MSKVENIFSFVNFVDTLKLHFWIIKMKYKKEGRSKKTFIEKLETLVALDGRY